MYGYVDLHCHPIPGIDDGAKSAPDGAALLAGLKRIGFDRVVATPHIRSGIWDNRRETVAPALRELQGALDDLSREGVALPSLNVAAEHLFDDVTWDLFARKEAMLYPGGRAALIEFPYDAVPLRVETRLWRLCKSGVTPVLAHPERYASLYRSSDRLQELIEAGVRPLLDLMSLVGVYGTQPREAAFRILSEGFYHSACSDAHKSADVAMVKAGLDLLRSTVGSDGVQRLLIEGPNAIVAGNGGLNP